MMKCSKDGGVQIRAEVAINASVIIHRRNYKITRGHRSNRRKLGKERKGIVGGKTVMWHSMMSLYCQLQVPDEFTPIVSSNKKGGGRGE
jgi:hypothetical protein